MFDNLSKDDRKRYLVIGVILLFVFSTFAIYLFNPIGGASGGAGKTSNLAADPNFRFTGRGVANATLLYWEPVLVVSGSSDGLDALLQPLKAQGIITKDLPLTGGRILGLSDAVYVANLSRDLLLLNLTVRGQGAISIAQAYMDNGAGTVRTVSGGVYNFEDTPVFADGDVFEVAFDADVTGNAITAGPINIRALPAGIVNVEFAPASVNLSTSFWQAFIPWQNRTLNTNTFEASLPGGDRVRYQMRSYVRTKSFITDQQKSALLSSRPFWLDSDNVQIDLIGVRPDYANRAQVSADLAALGITPVFPDSPLGVFPVRSNRSDAAPSSVA